MVHPINNNNKVNTAIALINGFLKLSDQEFHKTEYVINKKYINRKFVSHCLNSYGIEQ